LLNWLYNPFQSQGVADVYDVLSTHAPTERGLWLNLGYWRTTRTLDDACEAMAALLAERAGMGPQDEVLDLGFGFADQDVYWATHYRPRRIIGFNVTASQVAAARARVAALGLDGQIDLREGSATAIPLPDASCDLVTALECAFHFDTRARFFAEAHRVLRPGGRLVLADILPMPPASGRFARLKQRWSWRLMSDKFPIPRANLYTRDDYPAVLRTAGFEGVAIESIRAEVFAPIHRFLASDPGAVERLHPVLRPRVRLMLLLDPDTLFQGLDYCIALAHKPR